MNNVQHDIGIMNQSLLHFSTRLECHYEGPGKPDGTGIKWDTSAAVYDADVNLLGDKIFTTNKNTEALMTLVRRMVQK
jgi:hypothetical protein